MSSNDLWENHDEEHDEGWLVSYADMVTLLFGFFVILYSLSKVDEQKYEKMSQQIVEAFAGQKAKPDESNTGFMSEFRQLRAFKLLVEQLDLAKNPEAAVKKIEKLASHQRDAITTKKMIEKDLPPEAKENLKLLKNASETTDAPVQMIEINLPDITLFAPGSDEILPAAKQKLIRLGSTLLKSPNLGGIDVVGHTDTSLPGKAGKFRDNWSLSSARAGSVAQILINSGLNQKLFTVKGMAALQPLINQEDQTNKTTAIAMEKNRRVQIILKRLPKNE